MKLKWKTTYWMKSGKRKSKDILRKTCVVPSLSTELCIYYPEKGENPKYYTLTYEDNQKFKEETLLFERFKTEKEALNKAQEIYEELIKEMPKELKIKPALKKLQWSEVNNRKFQEHTIKYRTCNTPLLFLDFYLEYPTPSINSMGRKKFTLRYPLARGDRRYEHELIEEGYERFSTEKEALNRAQEVYEELIYNCLDLPENEEVE